MKHPTPGKKCAKKKKSEKNKNKLCKIDQVRSINPEIFNPGDCDP